MGKACGCPGYQHLLPFSAVFYRYHACGVCSLCFGVTFVWQTHAAASGVSLDDLQLIGSPVMEDCDGWFMEGIGVVGCEWDSARGCVGPSRNRINALPHIAVKAAPKPVVLPANVIECGLFRSESHQNDPQLITLWLPVAKGTPLLVVSAFPAI